MVMKSCMIGFMTQTQSSECTVNLVNSFMQNCINSGVDLTNVKIGSILASYNACKTVFLFKIIDFFHIEQEKACNFGDLFDRKNSVTRLERAVMHNMQ